MSPGRGTQSGVSLVELMMALTVCGIAIGAAFAVSILMQGQYRDHREMVNTEQAARVALEIIADGVRGSGPGVPTGVIGDAVGCSAIDALRVTSNVASGTQYDGIDVVADSDVIELVRPAGGVFTTLTGAYTGTSTALAVVSSTGFAMGDYALVSNLLNQGTIVKVSGTPTSTSLPTTAPNATCAAVGTPYEAGNLVIRARIERYFVGVGADDVPMLYVDLDAGGTDFAPEPLAPGIEDLQVAVGVDDPPEDGFLIEVGAATNDDEWHGNVASETLAAELAAGASVSWRAVRLTLVARAFTPRTDTASYTRPKVEDHAAASSADAYRRRVLSTIIELRNQGGSP